MFLGLITLIQAYFRQEDIPGTECSWIWKEPVGHPHMSTYPFQDVDGQHAAYPERLGDLIFESTDDVWQTTCPELKFQHPPYAEAVNVRSVNYDAMKLYYRYECRVSEGLKCIFWEKDPYDELLAEFFFRDIFHGMDISHQTLALINKKLMYRPVLSSDKTEFFVAAEGRQRITVKYECVFEEDRLLLIIGAEPLLVQFDDDVDAPDFYFWMRCTDTAYLWKTSLGALDP